MKKTLLICLLSIAFQSWSQAQVFPIRGCADEACSQERYKAIMNSVANEIYQETGFKFNDSISLTIKVDKKQRLKLTKSYAWINVEAPIRYFNALKSLANTEALIPGQELNINWIQEFDSTEISAPEIDIKSAFPVANACNEFNRKGKLACAKYVVSYQLDEALKKAEVLDDELNADLFYSKGRLKAVHISRAPILTKNVMIAFKGLPIYDTVNFNQSSLEAAGNYHIQYSYIKQEDPEDLNEFIEDHYDFYIQNQLWAQLRKAIDPYHKVPEIDTNNYKHPYPKALLGYLEDQLKKGSIPTQVWTVKEIVGFTKSPDSIQKKWVAPIFPGCDPNLELREQQKCFQMSIMKFVSQKFVFPEACKQTGQMGKIHVDFKILEDGSISTIEVNQKTFPLLDFEGIRVVSSLPNIQAPTFEGKPESISFTVPINAMLY